MFKSERCGVPAHNRSTRVGEVRRAVTAFALALAACATVATSSASAYDLDAPTPAEGPAAVCYYADARYSEGSRVLMGTVWKTCNSSGIWD